MKWGETESPHGSRSDTFLKCKRNSHEHDGWGNLQRAALRGSAPSRSSYRVQKARSGLNQLPFKNGNHSSNIWWCRKPTGAYLQENRISIIPRCCGLWAQSPKGHFGSEARLMERLPAIVGQPPHAQRALADDWVFSHSLFPNNMDLCDV